MTTNDSAWTRTIRREWLEVVTRECQTFYGRIILEYDSCNFERAADELVRRIPEANSALEKLLLRGLLLETALRWFAFPQRFEMRHRFALFRQL